MIKKFAGALFAMLITCVFGVSAKPQSKSSALCSGPPAISIIKQLLETIGQHSTHVYVNTEWLDAMTVNLTFVIAN